MANTGRGSESVGGNGAESLHGWGRSLGSISPAIEALAAKQAALEAEAEQLAAAVAKIAAHGENETAASQAATAPVEALAARLKALASDSKAEQLRKLEAEAEDLYPNYKKQHDHDEARLLEPRKSLRHERTADVSAAEREL
jgi:hypothetical protein